MILALAFLACSTPAPSTPAPTPVAAPAPAEKQAIVIKGSDSEVNVVQRLSEEFMKTHADVAISVTGGGSGTGVAALIDGTCTLANSSRDFEADEKVKAQARNVAPTAFIFATDAVGIVVNAKNPATKTDVATLGAIFRGEQKTWKALGGADKPVSLYGRQSNSGTYSFFKKTVVAGADGKGDYSADLKQMNGNAQIVEGITTDEAGIGYAAAGYVKGKEGIKLLNLVVDGTEIAPGDEAAVLSGKYPLARPLYQFMNGKPTGALKDFLAYEASDAGKAIIAGEGFYPVFPDKVAGNTALLGG